MKYQCYTEEMENFLSKIKSTSGKTSFTQDEMNQFVCDGNWKTRKTGRELNFGYDKHLVEIDKGRTYITMFKPNSRWKEWAKTIGTLIQIR